MRFVDREDRVIKNEDNNRYCRVKDIDTVNRVKDGMPHEDLFYNLAEFFKVFGDMTRVRILHALSEEELCVCDIAAILDMTHSAVSHQLRILKQSKLVKPRKSGKMVYYSPDDNHIKTILELGMDHINE